MKKCRECKKKLSEKYVELICIDEKEFGKTYDVCLECFEENFLPSEKKVYIN